MLSIFRRFIKPIVWFLVIAFPMSLLVYFTPIIKSFFIKREIIVNVGKEKVYKEDLENNFKRGVIRDDENLIVYLNMLINQALILDKARSLHIKVSSKEINTKFEEYISDLKSRLKAENMSQKELMKKYNISTSEIKNYLNKDIIIEKTKEIIQNYYAPNEKEIEFYYNQNKSKYTPKTLDEAKSDIIEELKNKNKSYYFDKWLEDEYSNKVKIIDRSYDPYLKKFVIFSDNLKIDNFSFFGRVMHYKGYESLMKSYGLYNEQQEANIYRRVFNALKEDLALAIEAKKRNLSSPMEYLSSNGMISHLEELLKKDVKDKLKFTQEDLKKYFISKRKNYDEKERAYADIILLNFKPSEDDKLVAATKANSLLKEILSDYSKFVNIHKTYGDDKGKWFTEQEIKDKFGLKLEIDKDQFHKEAIKVNNTYYIIRVEDKKEGKSKLSTLAIKENISDKTKKEIINKGKNILKDINENKINIKDAIKDHSELEKRLQGSSIYRDSVIYDPKLISEIFKRKVDELFTIETKEGIYIVKVTKKYPEKIANFEEFKEKIKKDYINEKSREEFDKLKKNLADKIKVEVRDDKIKALVI